MLNIEELKPEDESLWREYIINSKEATLYHTLGWRNVVQQALRHRPYYLVAKEAGLIKGVLPLFLVNGAFFGKALVSIPAANYAGICADGEETKRLLIKKAKELTHILKVDFLELREFHCNDYGLSCDKSHLTFLIPLSSSVNLIWHKLNKNVRSSIRKAIRSGLKARWYFNEWRDEFYNVYLHTMKRLGSPAYSKQFFKTILKEFPTDSCIVSVEYRGKIIASDFVVFFKKNIMPLVSGAYKEFLSLRPNNFISWEEIRYSCENGFEFYDFGRS
ncbi:MAG: peptidoglycan bridge formation glycyltransferase FemA/FemB family protein, partial [Candidatus Omnitrophota bacterium]|nr:peptidoglycan bridge formation glycyltransferase FemA/FemB family protein [Candidatus Omnitrophota bacterium]